ncbi:hypothetical protein RV134_140003 [Roseovarius sp. EC-HK134]|nr:hypothetical protein RV134_140003 [Roseovarius sp. EC-HK134]VVS96911.1 hypothetical protein RV420_170003 [Roseovarius sp. EC-SD190]
MPSKNGRCRSVTEGLLILLLTRIGFGGVSVPAMIAQSQNDDIAASARLTVAGDSRSGPGAVADRPGRISIRSCR